MSDFGLASFIQTKQLTKQLLVYSSESNPSNFYLFYQNSKKRLADGSESSYFMCKKCKETICSAIASVTIRQGRILNNPEIGHGSQCFPFTHAQVESMKIIGEAKEVCSRGQRPLQAFQNALLDIPRNSSNQIEQETVELSIGSYKRHRSSFYR